MDQPTPAPPAPTVESPEAGDAPKKRKKDKVRSAWISFIGRIVAQIVGAVVSIALAIAYLQRGPAADPPAAAPAPLRAVDRAAARGDGPISLAVLPLSNFSADGQQDYFADGMTEALIADLAQLDGLRVISRTSVMQYRGTSKSIPQVAQELGVDMIVEGSVVRDGDRVRITAQLIDTTTDHHVWAKSYERTMRDVLTLQGQVAAEIAREVKGAVTPLQQARLERKRQVDPEIYDLYLRGRQAWGLRSDEGSLRAIEHFEEVIRRDPTFALAYSGLSDVYLLPSTRANPRQIADSRTKALAAATKALEIDDTLAEAHTSRAGLFFFHERNRAAAEREFRRALELNPGYATAHQWFAILLSELGRDTEALARAKEAVTLDPLMGTMHQALGLVHYYGRRPAEAVISLRRALELAPQLPLAKVVLAKALFQQGDYAQALSVFEGGGVPLPADVATILGLSALKAGDSARAEKVLKDLRSRTPFPVVPLAQWYSVTGDRDQALALLTRAKPGDVPAPVVVDPLFDSIREDPRFATILQRGSL